MQPKICLTLTGKTIAEDLEILEKYRSSIDMVELRADFLEDNERIKIRDFPNMANISSILTIRRQVDGGQFVEGEASRTIIFARALSYAGDEKKKNFDYVDFEEDFNVPSLQDAALAFGTKIIRSVHYMDRPITGIANRLEKLRKNDFEIPKIAFMPKSLDDVTRLFQEAKDFKDSNHIVVAMGKLGLPSRILSAKLKNFLTFTSAPENLSNTSSIGHIDPVTLNETYHFHKITDKTRIFGITGWPLDGTSSPALHNAGFVKHGLDAVYIPMPAERIDEVFRFAQAVNVEGFSVTVPHKETALEYLTKTDPKVDEIGACNTVVRENGVWKGYNTDTGGFSKALLEFLGRKNLAHKKVAIIGAGGASHAICHAVKKLKGDACVFNRTFSKAKALAERFGFKYAVLSYDSINDLKKYSDIIIQTTSKGMHDTNPSNEKNDPLYFYDFSGRELLFDIIYMPEITPVMAKAAKQGCRVCNGYGMLKSQGEEQFKLFTGLDL